MATNVGGAAGVAAGGREGVRSGIADRVVLLSCPTVV